MQEYKGYVEHIIYRNEENTYTVFEVNCEEGLLTCTGFPPALLLWPEALPPLTAKSCTR